MQSRVSMVALAADHAGFAFKETVKGQLTAEGIKVIDLGTHDEGRVDYPDFGARLAEAIRAGQAPVGIGICGSGIGISMALNRYKGIRAALCHDVTTAKLARLHNDANVLCLGARITGAATASDIVDAFLSTEFEGGRHQSRVEKLETIG